MQAVSLHISISFAVAMYERPKILLEALSLVLLPYAMLFRPLYCWVINSVQDSQFAQQNYKYKQATAKTQIRQIQPYMYMEDKNFHF